MTTVKIFAGTHIGLRDNNEDNFIVCPNIESNEWSVPTHHQATIPIGNLGCLLVVADGMGGQNAGEVASEIAIHTVQEMFAPSFLPSDVTCSADSIKNYLKKVIIEADERIKKHSKAEASTAGMGSTIVIVWCLNDKVYVAWLGDSRAYCIMPDKGIGRLTKDHSFVQRLVDEGALTDEEAMVHPNSNIITRSLGDTSQKAKPEVTEYMAEKGMIILLCSDGLCGMCTDAVIGGIVEDEHENLSVCCDKLTNAALTAGGSDNITIALLEFTGVEQSVPRESLQTKGATSQKPILYMGIIIAVLLLILICKLFWPDNSEPEPMPDDNIVVIDTPNTAKKTVQKTVTTIAVSKDTSDTEDDKIDSDSSATCDTIRPSASAIRKLLEGASAEPTKNSIAIPQDVTPVKN